MPTQKETNKAKKVMIDSKYDCSTSSSQVKSAVGSTTEPVEVVPVKHVHSTAGNWYALPLDVTSSDTRLSPTTAPPTVPPATSEIQAVQFWAGKAVSIPFSIQTSSKHSGNAERSK